MSLPAAYKPLHNACARHVQVFWCCTHTCTTIIPGTHFCTNMHARTQLHIHIIPCTCTTQHNATHTHRITYVSCTRTTHTCTCTHTHTTHPASARVLQLVAALVLQHTGHCVGACGRVGLIRKHHLHTQEHTHTHTYGPMLYGQRHQ